MSTEKLEKMKIIKDDKNRLARKLTSLPPTLSFSFSFFFLTPLQRTIPIGPPPYISTLEKAGLLIVKSRALGASSMRRLRMRGVNNLGSATSSHNISSSSFFFGKRASWSSRVRIHFMTNEIPKALARNNSLFGWLEAVREVVVVGAKTGFQPLQLSRLSPLVLRLTPGSTTHVFVCARESPASRDSARRFSVLNGV